MPEVHQNRLISKKPFILLFIVLSLLVIIGGRLYYLNEVRTIRTEKHNELYAIADLKTDQIVSWLRERKSDALSVATSPFFSQGVNTWLADRNNLILQKRIVARLKIVQGQHRYADILLATPQGKYLLALDSQQSRFDPITVKQIVAACRTGKVQFTNFYYCYQHQRVHLDFIAPIANGGEKPLAALVLRNAPEEYLYPLIQKWPTPSKTAETVLIRQEGDSVLFLNNLRFGPNAALHLRISLADTSVPAVQAALGRTGIFEGRDYRGAQVLAHLGAVPGTNWFLLAKVDRQEIYADLNSELRLFLALVAALLVMIGVGMALIYNQRQRGVYHALYNEEKERYAVQEEFRTTLYSIGDAVITTDRVGKIKFLNPVAEKLTGWQEKEARGRNLLEVFNIVNEETRQAVPSPVDRVLKEGLVVGLANHTVLISKNKREIPIADSGAPIKDEDGAIIGVILVFRDQTAERNAQKAIRNSEKQFRTIWENSRDGMRLCNANGIMIRVNLAFCHMVGKPESELIGQPLSIIYDTDTADHILAKDIERFQSGTIEPHFERLMTLHDGRSVWFELSNSKVEINGEKLQLSIFRNITDRKLAEKDLGESEERFHSTLDSMIEGAQIIGFDWRYLYINVTAEKHNRRSRWELLGKKYMNMWPGAEQTPLFGIMKRCMEERIPDHIETEFYYQDGSSGLFDLSVQPMPQGIFILSVDITERRKAEEQIRYQADLLQNVSDAIIATDADNLIAIWNPAAETMYGWKSEDVVGKKFHDVISPEYRYESREAVFEKINREGTWSGEIVHHSKDGSPLAVLSTISVLKDAMGDTTGLVSVNHNITEQKQMEEQFRSVWEKSLDGMRLTDKNGTVVRVNDAFCRMMGIDRSEIEGRSLAAIYAVERREHIEKKHRERFIARTVKPYSEQEVVLRDGRKLWIEVTNSFFESGNKKPMLLGIFRNITDRKQREDAVLKSEEKYHILVESDFEGVEITQNDRIMFANTQFAEMLGYTPTEMEEVKFTNIFTEQGLKDLYERQKIRQSGKPVPNQYETTFLKKDGTVIDVEIRYKIIDYLGKPATFAVIRDITARKQMEEALRESEVRFRSLYENTAIGIYRTTPAGQILLANPALVQMLGYDSFTELAQLHLIEEGFAPEHPRREFQERIERDGEVRGLESSWKRKDGSTIFVRENARLVRDKNNKPIYYEGTAEDITARKQAEEALRKSEEQLRQTQKLEALGQLAGGIAHDFNNILAIIMGHSSLLKMGQQSPDKVQHSIETIEKTSKRGADLVKQMMTLARRSEPVIAAVNLINMITDTVKMFGETFPKVIVFKTDFQLSLPYILADASQINQVLMNLCMNARDAMPQGGTLRIAAKRESGQALRQRWTDAVAGQYVLISVSDTGVGMDQATVDHIFEPFFTTKGPSKGTGLGMATVHGIVSNHHGFVEVESKPGVGTKVMVYLPSPLPSEISIPRETEKQQKIKGGSETVLIIEDEELLIEMLNAVLSKSGYKVLMAKDGMEGIELYTREKDKIALVLTDMGLPQLMGDAVFRRIREINPKAKVILASGYLSPDSKSEFYKAGLARFIQKPFMPVDILRAVREVLDSE